MSREMSGLFEHVIAVTNRRLCQRPFEEQMERVLRCRPRAIILREKDLPEEEYLVLAKNTLKLCSTYNVPCILHTYWKTAVTLSCRAVHLPLPVLDRYRQETSSLPDTAAGHPTHPASRRFRLIGTSVHSVGDAIKAQALGADYITAGHIYATDCKKGLPPRGTDFLREVCQSVDIPVYGIGGIRLDKVQLDEIMTCGAKGGCIMSGMMNL